MNTTTVPLALVSAYRSDSGVDRLITATSFGMLSIPDFVLAIVLVFLFAVRAKLLPATGYVHLTDSLTGNLRSIALPARPGLGVVLDEARIDTRRELTLM